MKKTIRFPLFVCLVCIAVLLCARMGSRAVTAMAENAFSEERTRIVIDPGHGGVDGGATSCAGILESRYNLEIALRLNDLLQLLGMQTQMIRTEDVSVYTKGETIAQKKISDLKERVRQVNERENTLLLSIHQNFFPDSRYSGAQVFYADTQGSQTLAKQMQSEFTRSLNTGSHRNEKRAEGIYLMEHIACPGVLIECGFLSNPAEEAKLRSPEYQQKLCCVIASAVSMYESNT